jgi:poly-beta-1,6-N-acetyl-D-glucosamine synthase
MGSTDLVVAPRAAAVRDYPPLPGPAGERGALLIRAATRAGEARRSMSHVVHDLRHRPPRRRTAKMLVLIPAHNEEATIGRNLHTLLRCSSTP